MQLHPFMVNAPSAVRGELVEPQDARDPSIGSGRTDVTSPLVLSAPLLFVVRAPLSVRVERSLCRSW